MRNVNLGEEMTILKEEENQDFRIAHVKNLLHFMENRIELYFRSGKLKFQCTATLFSFLLCNRSYCQLNVRSYASCTL